MNFMRFIAQELREIMASLGFRTLEEMVGRTDCLKRKDVLPVPQSSLADLSRILDRKYVSHEGTHFRPEKVYDFHLERTKDEKLLLPALDSLEAEDSGKKGSGSRKIRIKAEVSSIDRTFGTILGSEITRRYGDRLPEDTVTVECTGGGGQSFGAFIPKGLTIRLKGDANDGFGKGLSGGKLVITPPDDAGYTAHDNIILGNVALYGATSGKAYVCGVAGERFCVRNSGALAVAEGCGDHGLEYMTGGRAVILGMTGKNFAAGMSGGIAYVLDREHTLYLRMNKDMASLEEVTEKYDVAELKGILEDYVRETGSAFAAEILSDLDRWIPDFKKIVPNDYQKMMTAISRFEERGLPHDEAVLEAFNERARTADAGVPRTAHDRERARTADAGVSRTAHEMGGSGNG